MEVLKFGVYNFTLIIDITELIKYREMAISSYTKIMERIE
jgi:hypothetical protein